MPSHIRLDQKAKTRGVERQMMRDAMRQYAKNNKLTMVEVRAHAPAGPSEKAKKRAAKK